MAVVAVFCVAAASPVSAAGIHGSVKDPSGGAVAAAEVLVLTPARAVVATVRTDASGRFVKDLTPGGYLLLARSPSFEERSAAVEVPPTPSSPSI